MFEDLGEFEELHPREDVCGTCRLVFWKPAGPCPTCLLERPVLALVKGA